MTFLCVAANALTHTTDTYSALSVEKLLIVVGAIALAVGLSHYTTGNSTMACLLAVFSL